MRYLFLGLLFYWIFLMVFVREFFIDFIAYCFQPLIGSVFSGAFHSQMTEPAVSLGAVQVLYISRTRNAIAGFSRLRLFAFFLIPAFAVYTQKNLSAAFVSAVNVPVIAAARLKSDVGNENRAVLGIRKRL